MSNNNILPQFRVVEAIITSDISDVSIVVTNDLLELNLYESLDQLYLTGDATFLDKHGFYSTIQFQGTERINLTIQSGDSEHTTRVLKKTFIIDSVINRIKTTNGMSSTYVFHLIDEIGFLSRIKKISKSFSGSLETITKKIVQGELKRKVDISYSGATSGNQELSVQGNRTCIIPNMTILEAIQWLSKRITTKNGSPYFVYSTLKLDDEATIENDVEVDSSLIRIGNLDTMLSRKAFNKTPFIYNPNAKSQTDELAFDKMFVIKSLKFGSSSNTLRLLEIGSHSSDYSNTDLNSGEIQKTKYSLKQQLKKLSDESIINSKQNVHSSKFMLKDEFIDAYSSKKYHTITSSGTQGNIKGYNESGEGDNLRNRISTFAIKNALYKNSIEIVVEGVGVFISGTQVGDIINVLIIGDTDEDFSPDNFKDPKYTGDYLIWELKHKFRNNEHSVFMTLCKLEAEE